MPSKKKLSDQYIAEAQEAFKLYDANEEMKFGKSQVSDVMNRVCIGAAKPKNHEIDMMVEGVSRTGDKVDFKDFFKYYQNEQTLQSGYDACTVAWELLFDLEKKNEINASQLREGMKKLGEKLNDEQAREMVKEIGSNGRTITKGDWEIMWRGIFLIDIVADETFKYQKKRR